MNCSICTAPLDVERALLLRKQSKSCRTISQRERRGNNDGPTLAVSRSWEGHALKKKKKDFVLAELPVHSFFFSVLSFLLSLASSLLLSLWLPSSNFVLIVVALFCFYFEGLLFFFFLFVCVCVCCCCSTHTFKLVISRESPNRALCMHVYVYVYVCWKLKAAFPLTVLNASLHK